MTDFAWVVEKGEALKPQYLFCKHGIYGWSHANQDALRFSRRVDAENVAKLFEDVSRVAQHGWEE